MKAYELLDSQEKWCQQAEALDKNWHDVPVLEETAVCFCAFGAILKCYNGDVKGLVAARKNLKDAIRGKSGGRYGIIDRLNKCS